MKKVFFAFSLLAALLVTASIAHAQSHEQQTICMPQTTRESGMSPQIQRMITSCESMIRIGELPNGDVIFFVSGLPTQSKNTETSKGRWSAEPCYRSGETFLLQSRQFDQWAIIGFNPSEKFTIEKAALNEKWEIVVLFARGSEKVPAVLSLRTNNYSFGSEADQNRVLEIPTVRFQN